MITNVRNPKWTSPQRKQIIVEIKSSLYPDDGWIPFVAGPSDLNKDEATIYGLAVNGHFGEVAPSDEELILAGEMPVPEGYAIIDGKLVNLADCERTANEELNRRLAPYLSAESQARALVDKIYAAERDAALVSLLAV